MISTVLWTLDEDPISYGFSVVLVCHFCLSTWHRKNLRKESI